MSAMGRKQPFASDFWKRPLDSTLSYSSALALCPLAVRESSSPFDPLSDTERLFRAYARVRARVAANFANFQPVARQSRPRTRRLRAFAAFRAVARGGDGG